jgi:methionine biosynthesis protein MetW
MYREIDKSAVDAAIAAIVEPGSSVFDIGCGDGGLLELLVREKRAKVLGLDIKAGAVLACLDRGLPAVHGDLNASLGHCRDAMYDYVILSRTLQVLSAPHTVLGEIARIGKKAIVSFPNFGHLSVRSFLFFRGRMPKSRVLPYEWFDSPNIHHLTVRDFRAFCASHDLEILACGYFGRKMKRRKRMLFPNLLAKEALFVIRKKTGGAVSG